MMKVSITIDTPGNIKASVVLSFTLHSKNLFPVYEMLSLRKCALLHVLSSDLKT